MSIVNRCLEFFWASIFRFGPCIAGLLRCAVLHWLHFQSFDKVSYVNNCISKLLLLNFISPIFIERTGSYELYYRSVSAFF